MDSGEIWCANFSKNVHTPQNIRIGVMEYIEKAEDTQRCRSSGSWAFRSQVECLLVAHDPHYTGYTDLVSRHAVYTQIYTCALLTAMFLGNPKWPSWCGERCAGALIACHGYSARRTRRAWSRSARWLLGHSVLVQGRLPFFRQHVRDEREENYGKHDPPPPRRAV